MSFENVLIFKICIPQVDANRPNKGKSAVIEMCVYCRQGINFTVYLRYVGIVSCELALPIANALGDHITRWCILGT